MRVTYVTGNWAKILSARQILEPLGFEVEQKKIETIEIQNDDIEEVAKYSAKWASEELKCNVIKNDTGLFIESLNGFPGTYTHFVDDTLGVNGILKLMDGVENRKAYFQESIAYCEYGKDPVVFSSITRGTIDTKLSGKYGWGWDFFFIPEGEVETLGCHNDDERFKYWSMDAYHELAKYLKEQK